MENVEKYEFSTAIPEISNSAPIEYPLKLRLITEISRLLHEIMSPWKPMRYLEKIEGKVGKLPKGSRQKHLQKETAEKSL